MDHYTYFNSLGVQNENLQEFLTALLIGGGLIWFASSAKKELENRYKKEGSEAIVPKKKISVGGIAEFLVESLMSLQDGILGKENRRYLPLTGSLFLFIFICNLVGLIPGMPAATTSVWITLGIALTIFFSFNYHGIREQGFVKYISHFAGPNLNMGFAFGLVFGIVMFLIEISSVLMRILTLNLRLYWNIKADHMVLGMFTEMTQYIVPMFFLVLGLGVAFMQAFVPTVLTMVYIMLATQHEEGEHH